MSKPTSASARVALIRRVIPEVREALPGLTHEVVREAVCVAVKAPRSAARLRVLMAGTSTGAALDAAMGVLSVCRACGSGLEDPASVKRGYGPDCWTQLNGGRRG